MEHQFHISLPCRHVDATRRFYTEILGGSQGRKAENWVDINLYGHQLTFTRSGKFKFEYPSYSFENTILPSFHFGVILPKPAWKKLYAFMKKEDFLYIDKSSFLSNKKGKHSSFFLRDPNGYIIEFKTFANPGAIFEQ